MGIDGVELVSETNWIIGRIAKLYSFEVKPVLNFVYNIGLIKFMLSKDNSDLILAVGFKTHHILSDTSSFVFNPLRK